MLLVASVQADPASQAVPGADCTVVALVASVGPPPVAKVVEVAVMLHPAPDPVASLTSRAWLAVTVWLVPLRVSVKVTLGGGVTKARAPAEMFAVAVAAPAGAPPASTPAAAAAVAHNQTDARRTGPVGRPGKVDMPVVRLLGATQKALKPEDSRADTPCPRRAGLRQRDERAGAG